MDEEMELDALEATIDKLCAKLYASYVQEDQFLTRMEHSLYSLSKFCEKAKAIGDTWPIPNPAEDANEVFDEMPKRGERVAEMLEGKALLQDTGMPVNMQLQVRSSASLAQGIQLFDDVTGKDAQTSKMNDDFGHFNTILSDKMGPLDCKQMAFTKCSIARVSFGMESNDVEIAAVISVVPRAEATMVCMWYHPLAIGSVVEFATVRHRLEVLEDRIEEMVQPVNVVRVMFDGYLDELKLASSTPDNSWCRVTEKALMTGFSGALDTLCGQPYCARLYRMIDGRFEPEKESLFSILDAIVSLDRQSESHDLLNFLRGSALNSYHLIVDATIFIFCIFYRDLQTEAEILEYNKVRICNFESLGASYNMHECLNIYCEESEFFHNASPIIADMKFLGLKLSGKIYQSVITNFCEMGFQETAAYFVDPAKRVGIAINLFITVNLIEKHGKLKMWQGAESSVENLQLGSLVDRKIWKSLINKPVVVKDLVKLFERKPKQVKEYLTDLETKLEPSMVLDDSLYKFVDQFLGLDRMIYLMGGYDGVLWLSALYSFSSLLDIVTPLKSMHFACPYASAAARHSGIYVFAGGESSGGNVWHKTVECYNAKYDGWTMCFSISPERRNLVRATIHGKMFTIGGGRGTDRYSDVGMLAPNLNNWFNSTSMLEKPLAVGVVALHGPIYAVGGYNGHSYLQSGERYNLTVHIKEEFDMVCGIRRQYVVGYHSSYTHLDIANCSRKVYGGGGPKDIKRCFNNVQLGNLHFGLDKGVMGEEKLEEGSIMACPHNHSYKDRNPSDGDFELIFYALFKATQFAKFWIPLCKKFNPEPRALIYYLVSTFELHDATIVVEWIARKKLYENMATRINAATNVWDNVGVLAGIGSDPFNLYAESSGVALVASVSSFGINHDLAAMFYPLLISFLGTIVGVMTTLFANDFFEIQQAKALETEQRKQHIISAALITVGIAFVSWLALLLSFTFFYFCGVMEVENWELISWVGLVIGCVIVYYTKESVGFIVGELNDKAADFAGLFLERFDLEDKVKLDGRGNVMIYGDKYFNSRADSKAGWKNAYLKDDSLGRLEECISQGRRI